MKSPLFPVAIALLAIACSAGCNSEREPMSENPLDNLYLSASSESRSRADRVLPNKGSEDASYVLGEWEPDAEPEDYDRDEYLPDPSVEWVIDVKFPPGKSVDAKELSLHFDKSFRERFGPCSLYGKDSQTGFWTFLVSRDGPEQVNGLKVAYDYNRSWDSESQPASAAEYDSRLKAVTAIASEHIGDCETATSKTPDEAAIHARILSGLTEKYDQTVAIHLVAEEGKHFEGEAIWDVMLCLGLQWGDMDCFHWNNFGGAGDDYYFSVETSTPPGYFLPEQIAAGQLQTTDLIFLFSVPRTCQPTEVAKRMNEAVQYCQRRLGGQIHYTLGDSELSMQALIKRVGQIESELTEVGFDPGTGAALRMF